MRTPLGWVRRAPAPLLRTSSTTGRHVTSDELLRPDPVHAGARLRVRRAVGLHLPRGRAEALQPRQARGLRVRHPADPAGRRWRTRPDQVLPDGDAVHHLRHRVGLPLPVRGGLQQAGPLRTGRDGPVHPHGVRRLRVRLAPRRPRVGLTSWMTPHQRYASTGFVGKAKEQAMGLEEKLPSGFLPSTVEGLAGYMRKASIWPATFGLACCAIEMMAVGTPDYDIARFGMERFSATPRQADLMIVAGRVSQKMAPVVRQVYDQMPNPKWVISMGVCASSGGMFNNYAIVQGVDHIIPVDIYLPGCPPRPEMLLNAIITLHEQIQSTPLGVNRTKAARAAEEAAMRATPTHAMKGLLA